MAIEISSMVHKELYKFLHRLSLTEAEKMMAFAKEHEMSFEEVASAFLINQIAIFVRFSKDTNGRSNLDTMFALFQASIASIEQLNAKEIKV